MFVAQATKLDRFILVLARDHLTPGVLEEIWRKHIDIELHTDIEFDDELAGVLAYAKEYAERLVDMKGNHE